MLASKRDPSICPAAEAAIESSPKKSTCVAAEATVVASTTGEVVAVGVTGASAGTGVVVALVASGVTTAGYTVTSVAGVVLGETDAVGVAGTETAGVALGTGTFAIGVVVVVVGADGVAVGNAVICYVC